MMSRIMPVSRRMARNHTVHPLKLQAHLCPLFKNDNCVELPFRRRREHTKIPKSQHVFNRLVVMGFLTMLAISGLAADPSSTAKLVGNAYVMDNNPAGNRIVVFGRFSNGKFLRFGPVPTGGLGAEDSAPNNPLGSQGSLLLTENSRTLYAINARSEAISM